MDGRHTFTAGLWIASIVLLALLLVRGGPWLWPKLFPGPEAGSTESPGAGSHLEPEVIAEVLHRELSLWGLTDGPEVDAIYLPRGRSPAELQARIRVAPELAGIDVYVTPVDDLLHRFRAFDGSRLLLQRDVRPWLPDHPVVSPVNPPEMAFVGRFAEPDDEQLRRICSWSAPVAVALPPFAPHTVKSARLASRAAKGVVLLLDPGDNLSEQLEAVPDASGVLLEQRLPSGVQPGAWLAPLEAAGLFLLDGRTERGENRLAIAARERGVPYVKLAVRLDDPGTDALARNLTVRRGYGVIAVDGRDEGISAMRAFIELARKDGYPLVFPSEIARMHGVGKAPPVPGEQ